MYAPSLHNLYSQALGMMLNNNKKWLIISPYDGLARMKEDELQYYSSHPGTSEFFSELGSNQFKKGVSQISHGGCGRTQPIGPSWVPLCFVIPKATQRDVMLKELEK